MRAVQQTHQKIKKFYLDAVGLQLKITAKKCFLIIHHQTVSSLNMASPRYLSLSC